MDNILPVLKSSQQLKDHKEKGLFVEELFAAKGSPFFLLGEDNGETTTYTISKGKDADLAIKEQALKNLEKVDVELDTQELEDFKIVLCQHEYAAEKILDKDFLSKVSQELGSDSLVIGIPIKGFFAAIAKGKGEANLYNAVVNQFDNAPTYPIANTLFYLVQGEIQMIGTSENSAVVQSEESYMEVTGENNEKGKVIFNAKVGHVTEEGLLNNIQIAFQQIIVNGIKDATNFSGKINFFINKEYNELTQSLENRIVNIAKGMSERGATELMGIISDDGFKVNFYYGDDQLIAETKDSYSKSSISDESKSKKKKWWKRNNPQSTL